ncbi:hypothetical protein CALVIDRAFT_562011 [Calocera viscosa TUFC12733]|uniref:Uncharacterized protein n=1 Tax=Calocera viscosa (strain TUFC12733) TaxID=1330018 RepID=A0A167P9M1_CALVF|nr:hypothetical protein CALVIDRAFT_562011 [Calocera viscosa TUFC12733]
MAIFPLDQAFILAIWMESCFYGILIPVFISSVYVLLYRKKMMDKLNWPMLIAAILMFALATAHMGINTYRLVQGYVLDSNRAKDAIYCTQTLLGDSLNIYRSWLVWNRNIWVVVVPIMLLIPAVVIGYYIPGRIFEEIRWNANLFTSLDHVYITVWYTLALTQNLITTSLIAFRLLHHERKVVAYRTGNFSLSPVIYIIVESAAFYVAAQLVLLVTFLCSNNAQYILLELMTPIVGIVFCLIITLTGLHAFKLRLTDALPTTFVNSGCSPMSSA